ncbi:hypothetical protein OO015_11990 [Thermomicrobium sp. 4228-Ro]|uniref:hypothetical protein n=1 Tax=Thermomicrobium sp. 4228-Ro TaxID=2993937 RepID=UPI002249759E|nr:hypothetical protein [Thermomicrobium sp. 4228-Ro]MCX2728210.1 hypothetical protein [Thermomicrobium sp. 4228-Ro]
MVASDGNRTVGMTRNATLARQFDAAAARYRLAARVAGPAPAPVVASAEVAVDRAPDGRPVRVCGALAIHGVTTWFVLDLASQRVTVRDARGGSWEGQLAHAPEAFRALAARYVGTGQPRDETPTIERAVVERGGVRLAAARALADQGERTELVLRVDDSELLARIRATRLALDWQFLALSFLQGQRVEDALTRLVATSVAGVSRLSDPR